MRCEICKSGEIVAVGRVKDWFLKTKTGSFLMKRCKKCGSYFLDPVPDKNTLKAAYPGGYWWNNCERKSGLVGKMIDWYRRLVAETVAYWINKHSGWSIADQKLRVIELGCGTGMLLAAGRDKFGWEVVGMDSSTTASDVARKSGIKVDAGDVEEKIPDIKRFDLVVLSHVLEHLRRPQEFLRLLRLQMRKNAKLVVFVPNAESLGVKFFGLKWRGFDPPRHLRTFSFFGLREQLSRAGFEIEATGRYSFRDDAAHLAGTLFPNLDPIVMASDRSAISFVGIRSVAFGILTMALQPIAWIEGRFGMGETMQIVATSSR